MGCKRLAATDVVAVVDRWRERPSAILPRARGYIIAPTAKLGRPVKGVGFRGGWKPEPPVRVRQLGLLFRHGQAKLGDLASVVVLADDHDAFGPGARRPVVEVHGDAPGGGQSGDLA